MKFTAPSSGNFWHLADLDYDFWSLKGNFIFKNSDHKYVIKDIYINITFFKNIYSYVKLFLNISNRLFFIKKKYI